MVDLTFPDGSVGEDEIFFLSISKKKKKKLDTPNRSAHLN